MSEFVKVNEDWLCLVEQGINYGALLLLCKIDSLSNNFFRETGNKVDGCWAGDDYFANLFCTSRRNIQKWIKKLKDAGYLKSYEEKHKGFTTKRYLYVQHDNIEQALMNASGTNNRTYEQMDVDVRTNVHRDTNDCTQAYEQMDTQIEKSKEVLESKREIPSQSASQDCSGLDAPLSALECLYAYFKYVAYVSSSYDGTYDCIKGNMDVSDEEITAFLKEKGFDINSYSDKFNEIRSGFNDLVDVIKHDDEIAHAEENLEREQKAKDDADWNAYIEECVARAEDPDYGDYDAEDYFG